MLKRLAGRNESIVAPELLIVDSHHHLYESQTGRYMLDEYLDDVSAGHTILASVYVETLAKAFEDGRQLLRPLGEVEFAASVAEESNNRGGTRVAAAIVGYADLGAGAAVAELLDLSLAAAPGRLRGVRQSAIELPPDSPRKYFANPSPSGLLGLASFRLGFAELSKRDLSFDAAVFHHQLGDVCALADAFPYTTIVLDHMAPALGIDRSEEQKKELFSQWRAALINIARRPNVVCKVGGLGMRFWGFGFESRSEAATSAELASAWRPYIETAVEAFGVDRCMMESNYPADSASCDYVPLWNALKLSVEGASRDEKNALFHGTAVRTYRIVTASPRMVVS